MQSGCPRLNPISPANDYVYAILFKVWRLSLTSSILYILAHFRQDYLSQEHGGKERNFSFHFFLLGALAGYCGYVWLGLNFGIFCLFATEVTLLLARLVSVSSYSGVYRGYKIKITANSGSAGNWWIFSLNRKSGFTKKTIKLPSEKKKCKILSAYEMQQGKGYSLPIAILDSWIGVPRSGGSIQAILSDGRGELLNSP